MSAAAAAASPASSPPQDAAIPAPQPSDRAAESAGAEDGIGGARGRRSAWNISSNGLSEVGGAVMGGAVSWPALSDSARASPKPSSSDSPKSLSDGSISAPPGPAITPPPPKQNMNNPSPSSTPTPASTSRQNHNRNHSNPIGRGGGGGGGNLANGGSPPPPPPPPPTLPSEPQPTIEETSQQSARSFRSRSNSSTDHGPRGSGGSTIYPHGGADNHHSRGNRRGHNGGVGGFGNRRNYSYRDAQQMSPPQLQHGPPPPFLRPPPPLPPPPPPPYMGFPPQVRPFIGPMGFPEIHSPMYYIPPYPPFESYKNIGYVAHQMPPVMGPPVVVTPEDHQHALMKQIEYYFSPENLCKDLYLRQKMDDQGWVPISFIANFNRVRQLATNLSYILETVRGSDMLEVEGEKIRRRNVWMNWILPPSSNPYGSTSWSQSPTPSNYDLAGHLQSAGLGEGAGNTGSSPNQVLTGVSSGGSTRRNVNSAPRVGESN